MLFVLVLVYVCNRNNTDFSVHIISLNSGSIENSVYDVQGTAHRDKFL